MPELSINKPLEQDDPKLVVENRLPPGRHRFALEVVDERGRVSLPAVWLVEVQVGRTPIDPQPIPR